MLVSRKSYYISYCLLLFSIVAQAQISIPLNAEGTAKKGAKPIRKYPGSENGQKIRILLPQPGNNQLPSGNDSTLVVGEEDNSPHIKVKNVKETVIDPTSELAGCIKNIDQSISCPDGNYIKSPAVSDTMEVIRNKLKDRSNSDPKSDEQTSVISK